MIASNLGQIIGRLNYGELEPVKREFRKRGLRRHQVLELLRQKGSVVCADLVVALGISSAHATVLLHQMRMAGVLVRSGTEKHYRYTLP
jgi:hypothetical protein